MGPERDICNSPFSSEKWESCEDSPHLDACYSPLVSFPQKSNSCQPGIIEKLGEIGSFAKDLLAIVEGAQRNPRNPLPLLDNGTSRFRARDLLFRNGEYPKNLEVTSPSLANANLTLTNGRPTGKITFSSPLTLVDALWIKDVDLHQLTLQPDGQVIATLSVFWFIKFDHPCTDRVTANFFGEVSDRLTQTASVIAKTFLEKKEENCRKRNDPPLNPHLFGWGGLKPLPLCNSEMIDFSHASYEVDTDLDLNLDPGIGIPIRAIHSGLVAYGTGLDLKAPVESHFRWNQLQLNNQLVLSNIEIESLYTDPAGSELRVSVPVIRIGRIDLNSPQPISLDSNLLQNQEVEFFVSSFMKPTLNPFFNLHQTGSLSLNHSLPLSIREAKIRDLQLHQKRNQKGEIERVEMTGVLEWEKIAIGEDLVVGSAQLPFRYLKEGEKEIFEFNPISLNLEKIHLTHGPTEAQMNEGEIKEGYFRITKTKDRVSYEAAGIPSLLFTLFSNQNLNGSISNFSCSLLSGKGFVNLGSRDELESLFDQTPTKQFQHDFELQGCSSNLIQMSQSSKYRQSALQSCDFFIHDLTANIDSEGLVVELSQADFSYIITHTDELRKLFAQFRSTNKISLKLNHTAVNEKENISVAAVSLLSHFDLKGLLGSFEFEAQASARSASSYFVQYQTSGSLLSTQEAPFNLGANGFLIEPKTGHLIQLDEAKFQITEVFFDQENKKVWLTGKMFVKNRLAPSDWNGEKARVFLIGEDGTTNQLFEIVFQKEGKIMILPHLNLGRDLQMSGRAL